MRSQVAGLYARAITTFKQYVELRATEGLRLDDKNTVVG
jgi:hypothetical protein